jgi:pyruvate formate-lyase activating enzyme-like uncharacterized protein
MKLISIQEALERKLKSQKALEGLELHASGHCAHIGKISPGCCKCFVTETYADNIWVGPNCNSNCHYCPANMQQNDLTPSQIRKIKDFTLASISMPKLYIPSVSFSGGEPLLYMSVLSNFMNFYNGIEKKFKKKPWYYLYTNGLSANKEKLQQLKGLGFDELRFHLGASNFSEKVYRNIKNAVPHFKAITVETPAWPHHRKKLFEMLPIIEDLGVKHLNIGEIELNKYNFQKIAKTYPKAEIYQCHEIHLYDGGLVYDIMKEVLKKKYSFSVLDCNSFTKSIQRSPGKWLCHENVKGLCAKY